MNKFIYIFLAFFLFACDPDQDATFRDASIWNDEDDLNLIASQAEPMCEPEIVKICKTKSCKDLCDQTLE